MRRMMIALMVLSISLVSFADTWTDPKTGIEWNYTVSDGQATIFRSSYSSAIPKSTIGEILIPLSLGGCPVASIGDSAFMYCSGLTSVTIPESVTIIGDYAFCGCYGLKSILIREGITSIGDSAFSGCGELTSVTIPDGVSDIGDMAFWCCSNITDVTFPQSITNIAGSLGVFYKCNKLSNLTIPACVKKIRDLYADSAFIKSITNIVVCKGTTSIGKDAFFNCSALTSVKIPASTTNIDVSAFHQCSTLGDIVIDDANTCYQMIDGVIFDKRTKSIIFCLPTKSEVTIPSEVASIGEYAFRDCKLLTTLSIPTNVTSIGYGAFSRCSALTNAVIAASVSYLGGYAFGECSKLTSVVFEGCAPTSGLSLFSSTSDDLVVYAGTGTSGWTQWNGKPLAFVKSSGEKSTTIVNVNMTITNVVIHYLTTNVPVNAVAPILKDTSIVNVMTEIEGGNIAIPDTWPKNYPDFTKRFGSDFSAALTKYTGKYDGAGNPLFVWQDYVAGTDPTDIYDVFTATITMIEGNPQVQWSPELVAKEAAKRVYTKYGKVQLQDEEWVKIPEGEEGKYNFFKVTVKMK